MKSIVYQVIKTLSRDYGIDWLDIESTVYGYYYNPKTAIRDIKEDNKELLILREGKKSIIFCFKQNEELSYFINKLKIK